MTQMPDYETTEDDCLGNYREISIFANETGAVYCGISKDRTFLSIEEAEEYIDLMLDGEVYLDDSF